MGAALILCMHLDVDMCLRMRFSWRLARAGRVGWGFFASVVGA